jgi:osmotically-inducible protein OsmY
MPRQSPPAAPSYDEIVRKTVPEPDSSWRPTTEQERAAYQGARILSEDEQVLHARVSDALLDSPGLEFAAVGVEVDDTRVELRGRVADVRMIDEIERRVAAVDGVSEVSNRLVVAPAE